MLLSVGLSPLTQILSSASPPPFWTITFLILYRILHLIIVSNCCMSRLDTYFCYMETSGVSWLRSPFRSGVTFHVTILQRIRMYNGDLLCVVERSAERTEAISLNAIRLTLRVRRSTIYLFLKNPVIDHFQVYLFRYSRGMLVFDTLRCHLQVILSLLHFQ